MCRYAARNHHNLNSWLFAVPLAHFLTQESEPFNAAVLLLEQPQDRDYTWWGGSGFETKAVRERTVGDDGYGRTNPWKLDVHAIIYFICTNSDFLADLYHRILGCDTTTTLMSLSWCNSRGVNSTYHCHYTIVSAE